MAATFKYMPKCRMRAHSEIAAKQIAGKVRFGQL